MAGNGNVGVADIIELDALVVGAGFSGLYMLHLLRDEKALKAKVLEGGAGVGGTWYWNRYPGARCDIPSHHYSYSFSDELQQEWKWSEKYSGQEEILQYLEHVATRFKLYPDIEFDTRVKAAWYDEEASRWDITTESGDSYRVKYFIPAVGALGEGVIPKFKGSKTFKGESYFTGRWPEEGVDFTGKKVAIIGTGATAMQVIPIVASEAEHLTVFQRTPNYAAPLCNEPMTEAMDSEAKANYSDLRKASWEAFAGVPFPKLRPAALADTEQERLAHYEDLWNEGGFGLWIGSYEDLLFDKQANETAAEFVRGKIREIVDDPEVAEMLCPPKGQSYGTKRQPCETGYYEAFNRNNVTLVDINQTPIQELTETSIKTADQEYEIDCLIYATGFDAFTGALFKMDIRGRGGKGLNEYWADGPRTYLGLSVCEFPNLFLITGPQSPSVLFNMPLGIEMHCEWIAECIQHLNDNGLSAIEPKPSKQDEWIVHTKEVADETLLPDATSWYMGGNVPGKPQVFMVYLGGGKEYKEIIDRVAEGKYKEFELS